MAVSSISTPMNLAGGYLLAARGNVAVAERWSLGIDAPGIQGVFIERVPATLLYHLLLLNIALQMFDGVATYNGLRFGIQEANPLLCMSFAVWGVGTSLLLFKTLTCALLLVLYWLPESSLVASGFCVLAALYAAGSLIPWLVAFTTLLSRWL